MWSGADYNRMKQRRNSWMISNYQPDRVSLSDVSESLIKATDNDD